MRQAQTLPVLDAYWAWVEKLEPEPGGKLAEAVRYARSQKQALNAFLEYGEVDISNNLAENAIRPFVIGRKNWLFCDTPKGAEASAAVYSLVETAKANGLEPYAYLRQLMQDLPWYGSQPSEKDLEVALPWSARMQELTRATAAKDL